MLKPNFEEFKQLLKQGGFVPVYREFLADMETPVSVLNHFTDDTNVFLLESVEGGERFGRYSFIGIHPYAVFTVEKTQAYLTTQEGLKKPLGKPGKGFLELRTLMQEANAVLVPGLPPLFGGAVGCMNYEIAGEFEHLPVPKNDSGTPEAAFMLTREMIIFDNVKHVVMISVSVKASDYTKEQEAYQDAEKRIEKIYTQMTKNTTDATKQNPIRTQGLKLIPNMSKADYCEIVRKCKERIKAGDIIQVVPAQKFSAENPLPPLQIYRALRLINPSPYLFYLKLGERILIGSSPETMVKLENGTAALRPIAGTRRRGITSQEDSALANELLSDEKERAEHLMLVDLGRNDLGRLAAPGSVQLRSFMQIERYSHVMHLVSNIEAILKDNADAFDLAIAAFPAGTLSGAPKLRAMEIIHELEPEARGFYGGAVGYFSSTGNMDLGITIRTLEINHGKVTIGVGAGIVADSIPENEYEETLNKAGAMMKALKLAADGLTF